MTDRDAALHGISSWDRLVLGIEHHGNRMLRPVGTALYRLTRGRIAPRDRLVVLLTTTGRRTGRRHTVLLQAFDDGECMILVAANAGRGTLPDWYRNLLADGRGEIDVRGCRYSVRAEPVAPEIAETIWPRILRVAPTYARFRESAGRDLPLLRLHLDGQRLAARRQ